MSRPSVEELLDRGADLANRAVEESADDAPARLVDAAGKAWSAARLSMAAVVDHFTHHRPTRIDPLRDALEGLAEHHRKARFDEFRALVGSAFSDLHLRAEERADFSAKVLRHRVAQVQSMLVPLAREWVAREVLR